MLFLNTYGELLLYAGLALFIVQTVLSIVLLRSGAGVVHVALTLISCLFILLGLIGISFPNLQSQPTIFITLTIAVLGIVAGIALFVAERQLPGFIMAKSSGLLVIGCAIFSLIAALIIPTWPAQLTLPPPDLPATFTITPSRTIPPTRTPRETATITLTPSETSIPTDLPTLTHTPTEAILLMPTSVLPTSTSSSTPSPCYVRTTTTVRLRPDPSTRHKEVAIIGPDTLLPVTGLSPDRQWWQVVYAEFSAPVEGWVNAGIVAPEPNCATIQPFTITPTLTRTPTSTRTPSITRTPSRTRTPSLTKTPSLTRTPSLTKTPTLTRTPSLTRTPTWTLTPKPTLTPSRTLTPTRTYTPTPIRSQ